MPRRTLGLKITLYFLIVAFLPFAIISALFYFQVKQNTSIMVRENLSNLASEIGVEVEKTIFSASTHIGSLVENPIIKSEQAKIEEKLVEMQKIHNFYRLFEDITLVNLDGVVLTSTTYEYRGKWKYKQWFQQAKAGEIGISPVHAILRPFRLVIINTAPVIGEDGAVKAVLAGRVNMQRIWEITDRVKIGRTGFVFITDREGNLIAFPDKDSLLYKVAPESIGKKILIGQTGTTEYLTAEGIGKVCHYRVLKGYGDYKGQGWRIGMTRDVKEAYAIIDRIKIQLLAVATGGFLLILLLSGLLSRGITRPIKDLVKTTERIAEGDLATKASVMTKDEIGDLGNSFNRMAENLQKTTVSRDYVDSIIKSMIDTLIVITPEGNLQTVNHATVDLLGYKEEELIGKPFVTIFAEEVTPFRGTRMKKLIEEGSIRDYGMTYKTKSGEKIPVSFSGSVMRDKEGELLGIVGVARDMREIKRLMQKEKKLAAQTAAAEVERKRATELEKAYKKLQEAQDMLIQAEKLNAVGQLASGVAHEVRNPLGIIVQGVDYLEMRISPKQEDIVETLTMLKGSVKRADKIINSLLDFSRATKLDLHPEDINCILEDSLTLVKARFKFENIDVIRETKKDISKVLVDKNKLEQVFVNALLNAIQAMPEGGKIIIRSFDKQLEEVKNGIGKREEDPFRLGEKAVIVEIEDTGPGIPEEKLKKVFDPFFTTRGPSGGSGLGLSVSRNIITMHRGLIDIKSQINKGTKVTITFKIAGK